MKKLRIIALLVLALCMVLSLCSCKESEEEDVKKDYPTKTLNVYNWGEYISDEDDEESGLIDVNSAL